MSGQEQLPRPKRVGPPNVAAVVLGTVRYEALPWGREHGLGQNGGYVVANDLTTGHELWRPGLPDRLPTSAGSRCAGHLRGG